MNENTRSGGDPCSIKYDYKEYSEVLKTLEIFLDSVIKNAVRIVAETKHDVKLPECTLESFNYPDNGWPTCGSINVQNAGENIEKLMNEWKSVPVFTFTLSFGLEDWMFNVEFIALNADQSSDFYLYEVKWSVPTPEYPIPQVTASVFFSIEATRVKAKSYPVDVTYVFEGTQFVHRPEIPFQQKWLYDILDVKTLMFKSFHF